MCYFLFHPVYLHLPVTEVQVKVQHAVVLQRCGFTKLFTTVSCFTPVATDCFCLIHRHTLQTVKGYFAALNLPQDCSLSLSDYLHKNKMLKKNKFQRSRFIFFVEVEFYKRDITGKSSFIAILGWHHTVHKTPPHLLTLSFIKVFLFSPTYNCLQLDKKNNYQITKIYHRQNFIKNIWFQIKSNWSTKCISYASLQNWYRL